MTFLRVILVNISLVVVIENCRLGNCEGFLFFSYTTC